MSWSKQLTNQDFPDGSDSKESACNAGDLSSIPGLGRSLGEGNGNLLQYSCLGNSMGRRAWLQSTGITKIEQLSLTHSPEIFSFLSIGFGMGSCVPVVGFLLSLPQPCPPQFLPLFPSPTPIPLPYPYMFSLLSSMIRTIRLCLSFYLHSCI